MVFRLLLLAVMLTGCSSAKILNTKLDKMGKKISFPPITIEEVEVFKSTKPSWKFEEIGVIVVNGESVVAEHLYKQLRKAAAENGAHAVVDIRFKSGTKQVTESREVCQTDAEGRSTNCSTQYTTTTKNIFTATGSLLRRIK